MQTVFVSSNLLSTRPHSQDNVELLVEQVYFVFMIIISLYKQIRSLHCCSGYLFLVLLLQDSMI